MLTANRTVCDYSVMALRCVARIGRNKMSYVLIVMWLYEAAYGSTSTSMEIEFMTWNPELVVSAIKRTELEYVIPMFVTFFLGEIMRKIL